MGFSKDPADYRPAKVKFAGPEFNDKDPKYRSDLDPDGFLIGGRPIGPEGVSVIILGSLSGYEEKDRVTINGKEEKRRFAIWKNQPEVTPVQGKGGGLKTDRGGWITGRFDEIFLLVDRELSVATLYDIVQELNRQASLLGLTGMYEAKWLLTKHSVPDGDYLHHQPNFECLGVKRRGERAQQGGAGASREARHPDRQALLSAPQRSASSTDRRSRRRMRRRRRAKATTARVPAATICRPGCAEADQRVGGG